MESPFVIGILAITAPGAAMCYERIMQAYPDGDNPTIIQIQPPFAPIKAALVAEDWGALAGVLLPYLTQLKSCGARFAIMPSNTPHFAIDVLKGVSPLPLLDITEVVTAHAASKGYRKVLVLGTKWTMQKGLYVDKFAARGIEHVVPDEADMDVIQRLILDHFVPMIEVDSAQKQLQELVAKYRDTVDAVSLACTELPMVLTEANCGKPVIDTTRLLGGAAVAEAARLTASVSTPPSALMLTTAVAASTSPPQASSGLKLA